MRLRALGNPMSWRRPFDGSVDRERLRRRLLVFTGLWFLMGGLLAALGFGVVLRLTFAIVVVGGGTAGGLWLLRRYEARQRLRAVLLSIKSLSRHLKARLDDLGLQQHARGFVRRVPKMAAVASDQTRLVLARGGRSSSTAVAQHEGAGGSRSPARSHAPLVSVDSGTSPSRPAAAGAPAQRARSAASTRRQSRAGSRTASCRACHRA